MRRRIVMLAASTALLAVVLLSIPLGVLARNGYLRDERLELQQAAASAAARARGDVASTAPARLLSLSGNREIRVSVYDQAGHRVSGQGPRAGSELVQEALDGREGGATSAQTITVAAPVSDGDQVVAVLLVSISLDVVHERTLRAWLLLAAMDLVAVLVAGAAAVLVARRLARPLDRLAKTAERVGAGDLGARARASGIAEIDTLATTLNGTVDRVRSMIGRERAFSAEVSHQLRTPLSGLRLELESAQREMIAAASPTPAGTAVPVDGVGASLGRALRAIDRLEDTLTDVIALARDLPVPSQVDVADVLEAVAARWHGPLAARSRPLRCIAAPDGPAQVGISRAAATQIVDVLVDNAFRHGRGAVTVRVGPVAEGLAVIEVADEGPALVVEPWQLFGRRDDHGSHGLGLPFARRLAEAEGARLTLGRPDPPTFSLTVAVPEPSDRSSTCSDS